jgi:hypothetical protein
VSAAVAASGTKNNANRMAVGIVFIGLLLGCGVGGKTHCGG